MGHPEREREREKRMGGRIFVNYILVYLIFNAKLDAAVKGSFLQIFSLKC
jgi:hypothetical protein